MEEDIAFLSRRHHLHAKSSYGANRETGMSSNSIVDIAYGVIDICEQILPADQYDLAAVKRMWKYLPEHRKTPLVQRAWKRACECLQKPTTNYA